MQHPMFFEPAGVRLFAMAHRPAARAADVAVVFCHAFGEEKQLSEPVLVRCARLLAVDGFPVLRFDARGHGDSDGEPEDATVATLVDEALAAGRLAREQLLVRHVVYLGLRLGACIAALAAGRDPAATGLVVWAPVLDGARHADEMIRKRLFAAMLEKRPLSRGDVLAELERTGSVEIEGNRLGRRFHRELAALTLEAALPVFPNPVLVCMPRGAGAAAAGAVEAVVRAWQARGTPCELASAGERPFWERSAMYDLYCPEDVLQTTRGWLCRHWAPA